MTQPLRSLTVGGPTSARQRKPQTETLAEKLAFNDPDRTTPVHDEICLWLDDKLRDEDFLWVLLGGRKSWNPEAVSAIAEEYRKRQIQAFRGNEAERWIDWTPPPHVDEPFADCSVTWELAVGNERWVSGFIDVAASVEQSVDLTLEPRYCPASQQPRWEHTVRTRSLAFEVKSTIPSLGELIRQIRYYEHKHRATYYVVAPDASHITTLSRQGIGFIEYPSGSVRNPRT